MYQQASKPEQNIEFDVFVRANTSVLRAFIRKRVRDMTEVDDLVQEVFLRLARHGLSDVVSCRAYLFQTAINVLRDRGRRRATHHADAQTSLDNDNDYVNDTDFSPERVLIGKETLKKFDAALQELPARTQEVFALNRLENWRNADIAHKLGISVSAVEKHLTKAMVHLSKRLEGLL